ncbi:MAG: transposase [Myxococcales bacterium]|nr:transposase [Myxococcales bacterium]
MPRPGAITLPRPVRRKQMDGLSTLVREAIKRDPRDGELYLFRNRNRSMIKILFYDHPL